MNTPTYERALIVGAGAGLSAALARRFSGEGLQVALAARQPDKLEALCAETGARAFACDATRADQVTGLFADMERTWGAPESSPLTPEGIPIPDSVAALMARSRREHRLV